MTPRLLLRAAAVAALALPATALTADIVLSPPASGGVAITNATGNTIRLRVGDDGTVTLPGLAALPAAGTILCLDLATGKVGTCPAGSVGTSSLADQSVTTAKLADGAVTAAKLASSGCTTDQILKYNGSAWVCASDANTGAPLPTVPVASLTTCCFSIANTAVGEANAKQVLLKGTGGAPGKYLARVDAQLNNFGALWFDYHCKLQSLAYPALLGTPFTDLPGTRRDVSWRTGKDGAGNNTTATGVSISMQAPVTAGAFGLDVRMVCWGTIDPAGPLYDYGFGVESAVLTLLPVGNFN